MLTSFRRSADALVVGGLTPFTTIDFPGRLAAVVFCQGCPLRCGYCQNPDLIDASAPGAHAWRDVVAFLESRRGLIDAVVFSGGEPLVQGGLAAAMAEVRDLGFAVGLHTSGAAPARLRDVLPLVDWAGFDAKAPFDAYARVTGVAGSGTKAREALMDLLASGVDFEARTTLDPGVLEAPDVLQLADEISGLGVTSFALQAMRPAGPATRARLPRWARDPAFVSSLNTKFKSVTFRES